MRILAELKGAGRLGFFLLKSLFHSETIRFSCPYCNQTIYEDQSKCDRCHCSIGWE